MSALAQLRLLEPPGPSGQLVTLDPDTALVRLFEAYEHRVQTQIDELVRLQQSAETLVHTFRPAIMRQNLEVEVDVLQAGSRQAKIRALVAGARTSAWSMHPGPLPPAEILTSSLAHDAALIGRGLRLRAVYAQSAASSQRGRRYLTALAAAGADVRLVPQLPFDLVIYDSHTALLPQDPAQPAGPGLILRGSRLMPTYIALYEDVWLRAVRFAPTGPSEPPAESTVGKGAPVLRLLSQGLTDDQIGRRLGISARTVGRAVAELMEQMGAASRFQLGTLAATRGLLNPGTDTTPDPSAD
ncbi:MULTISPECIES: helix-turn-helix transcriptional regulator [unclassified Streptomyces]|uniref:helix-turn-helix transcriptional regulator n=1 Tax=unclassified Streptomyces TaxID=2593676 RepID=UPI002E2CBCFD|nr:helix-turn-helix transcriptional regulator [Streptomyces sp. NBC_00223]